MNTPYRYRDFENPNEIRLVRLTSRAVPANNDVSSEPCPSDEADPIPSFDLITTNLDDAPPYETVSYVWGDGLQDAKQLVGSHGFLPITQLLMKSLSQVASAATKSYLWIDQICINQSSTQEKNHQVKIMGEIYRRSYQVLIYLAPELFPQNKAKSAEMWMDGNRVWRCKRVNFKHIVADLAAFLERKDESEALKPIVLAAVYLFLVHPWFCRGWTFQEAAISARATIVSCGKRFSMKRFSRCADLAMARKHLTLMRFMPQLRANVGYFRLECMLLKDITQHPLWVLDSLSSDSRFGLLQDNVYGFLGVMTKINIVPDYNQTWQEVFTRTAASIIEAYGTLQILSFVRRGLTYNSVDIALQGKNTGYLPTWVPRWFKKQQPWVNSYSSSLGVCANRKHTVSTTIDLPYLRVRGGIIGFVTKVHEPTWSNDDEDCYVFLQQLERFGRHVEEKDPQKRIQDVFMKLLFILESSFPAIWNALIHMTDLSDDPSFRLALHLGVKRRREKLMMFAESLRLTCSPKRPFFLLEPQVEQFLTEIMYECFQVLGCRSHFRLHSGFEVSTKGTIDIRDGDVVCILHGSYLPVVLRPLSRGPQSRGARYKFVDLCYLDRGMDGEAVTWAEDEAEEFLLC